VGEALQRLIKYGMELESFWPATPYQTKIWLNARIERLSEQHKKQTMDNVWVAYHVANWTRAKRMPNWDKLMTKMGLKERKIQTPEEVIQIAAMLTAAMGGKDLRKEKDLD